MKHDTAIELSFTYCVTILFCAMLFGTNNIAEDGGRAKSRKFTNKTSSLPVKLNTVDLVDLSPMTTNQWSIQQM